ncbi:MAG: hypothetical protein ACWGNV_05190 [Bacteroidales bacterium]
MKPFRIFIFFASVLLLLALIATFMPEHGIVINRGVRFTFISLSDVFRERTAPEVNKAELLLAGSTVSEDPEADPLGVTDVPLDSFFAQTSVYSFEEEVENPPGISTESGFESGGRSDIESGSPSENPSGNQSAATAGGAQESEIMAGEGSAAESSKEREEAGRGYTGSEDGTEGEEATGISAYSVRAANADSLQKSIYPIQFPEYSSSILDPFFHTLDELKDGDILRTRILHFGDSQIENDRMTALIRYRLQKMFGGTGSGLVQAIPLYSGSMSYHQEYQGDFLRYTYFRNRDTTINHNSYGVMAAFAAVPPPSEDGWPMLHYSFNLSRRSGQCDRVRVFLHSYMEGANLVFQVNDTISDTIRSLPGGYSVADYRHVGIIKDLRLYLDFPEGGRIYGLSFESNSGVQMDNIALRGSSGLIFSKMDRQQEETMMRQLAPSLILLQFGGNVVPYMNPRYYRREFEKELTFFKEICPGVPVIVIGPADMSIREKGMFKTYPGLEKIRDALKYATLESGFAFWDLYEAMGGHNSMPSFVHADPPLASTDYVHFNGLGINVVAEMFYNSLMFEYQHHVEQNSHP